MTNSWREPAHRVGSLHIFLYSKGTPSWIRSQSILRLSAPLQLAKAGIYPYAEHPDFDLLLFGYAVDGGPVEVVDLASRQTIPEEILAVLVDPDVIKWAYNASFERVCLSAWLRRHRPELLSDGFLDPAQWRCTVVLSLIHI